MRTFSETFFEQWCQSHCVPCEPIPTGAAPTPDFAIYLAGVRVACEIKQIDPDEADVREMKTVSSGHPTGRFVPNRLRAKLKLSAQLRAAAESGCPTLLVVYDNTAFKMYSGHQDVIQAMFGANSIAVRGTEAGELVVSEPFFGGNRG